MFSIKYLALKTICINVANTIDIIKRSETNCSSPIRALTTVARTWPLTVAAVQQ